MAAPPMALPPLDNSLGAFNIGNLLAAVLLGVVFAQAWTYYSTYGHADSLLHQALVAVMVIGNCLHEIFICHAFYFISITHYGDPTYLAAVPWSFVGMSTMNAIISLVAQVFYIVRIFRLSERNFIVTGVLGAISAAQFITNIIMCVKVSKFTNFAQVTGVEPFIKSFMSLAAAVDILIAICMIYLLLDKRTGFASTDKLMVKLAVYCAHTGLITSIAAILTIVLLVAYNGTSINFPPYFAMGRLYAISLLGVLNARKSLRGYGTKSTSGQEISLQSVNRSNEPRGVNVFGGRNQSRGLVVQIDHSVMRDGTVNQTHHDTIKGHSDDQSIHYSSGPGDLDKMGDHLA